MDVISLYPLICKYGKIPLGQPKVYVDADCPPDCLDRERMIKCKVLPPSKQYHLVQGFSKGVPRHTSVPRNFCTVPREKVLGKGEHIKKGCVLNIKYYTNTIVISAL